MELLTKPRFAELWRVLVERKSTETQNDECALKISNGVSDRLAEVLIASSNDKPVGLAAKFKIS